MSPRPDSLALRDARLCWAGLTCLVLDCVKEHTALRNVSPRGLVASLVLAAILPTLAFYGAGSPIAAVNPTPVTIPPPTVAYTPAPQPFQEASPPAPNQQATPAPRLSAMPAAAPTPRLAAAPRAADRSRLMLALGGIVVVGGMLVGLIGILRSR